MRRYYNHPNWLGPAIIAGFIVLICVAFWFAPQSWWDAVAEMAPDEHYEQGQRIRTIRGQDFVVTGWGDHEKLVPIQAPTTVVVITNYVPVEK